MAYQIGRLVGFLLVPLLFVGLIGLVQYFRTGDKQRALRTAFSWWAIGLAVACLFLGIIAQTAQRLP